MYLNSQGTFYKSKTGCKRTMAYAKEDGIGT